MQFDLPSAQEILRRTPAVLHAQLRGLPDAWVRATEGPDTWSAFDVVGHLVHGERTDWLPRVRVILEHGTDVTFEPFDRFAQQHANANRTMETLLDEFAALREQSLAALAACQLTPAHLAKAGMHPALGVVTLGQLLSTWVVHDLGHLGQIARVMARRYTDDVGPWRAYLRVLG